MRKCARDCAGPRCGYGYGHGSSASASEVGVVRHARRGPGVVGAEVCCEGDTVRTENGSIEAWPDNRTVRVLGVARTAGLESRGLWRGWPTAARYSLRLDAAMACALARLAI